MRKKAKFEVVVANSLWGLKEKVRMTLKNKRGDVNYPLTVAMFSVIILVFGYPILKSIVTTIFGDIQHWWNNNGSKIFDQVVQQ